MPTKERLARERARKALATKASAGHSGMPPQLARVIDGLRSAGIDVQVQVMPVAEFAAGGVLGGASLGQSQGQRANQLQVADSLRTPAPLLEIPAELDMLHHSISELALVYDALDSRLIPISTPVVNGGVGPDQAGEAASLSSLGDQIRAARQRIQAVTASVVARTERLGV